MCRNIKPLFNYEPPATREEIHEAAQGRVTLKDLGRGAQVSVPRSEAVEAVRRALAEGLPS